MAQSYEWTPGVATAIRQLPPRTSQEFRAFLVDLERGSLQVPSEVVAFLVREAYAQADTPLAERLFQLLFDRHAAQLAVYTSRYRTLLRGAFEPQDVIVQVFVQLFNRLSNAPGVTFYERAFLPAMRRNTIEICARMVHGEEAPPQPRDDLEQGDAIDELEDPNTVSPETHVLVQETIKDLHEDVRTIMETLPANVRFTAVLMVQGHTQEEIAAHLGVTSRMVRHYKGKLKQAMRGLAGV